MQLPDRRDWVIPVPPKILKEEGLMLAGTTTLERDCGVWIVTLRGEHDLSTASGLRRSLARSFSGGSTVIVDMSQADSIDSTTLHVLIRARRQRHAIALVAPTGSCARRLADLVSLADGIPTFQTRAEALAHLGAADAEPARTIQSIDSPVRDDSTPPAVWSLSQVPAAEDVAPRPGKPDRHQHAPIRRGALVGGARPQGLAPRPPRVALSTAARPREGARPAQLPPARVWRRPPESAL